MTKFIVYCHTNMTNGKKYIGITSQKPERRWRNGHGYLIGAFHRAITKYGWGGFSHDILASGLDEKKRQKLRKNGSYNPIGQTIKRMGITSLTAATERAVILDPMNKENV